MAAVFNCTIYWGPAQYLPLQMTKAQIDALKALVRDGGVYQVGSIIIGTRNITRIEGCPPPTAEA